MTRYIVEHNIDGEWRPIVTGVTYPHPVEATDLETVAAIAGRYANARIIRCSGKRRVELPRDDVGRWHDPGALAGLFRP